MLAVVLKLLKAVAAKSALASKDRPAKHMPTAVILTERLRTQLLVDEDFASK